MGRQAVEQRFGGMVCLREMGADHFDSVHFWEWGGEPLGSRVRGRGGGRGLSWGGGPWATSTHLIANESREGYRLVSTRNPCAFQGHPGCGMEEGKTGGFRKRLGMRCKALPKRGAVGPKAGVDSSPRRSVRMWEAM